MQPDMRLLVWTLVAFCIAAFIGLTTAKVIGDELPVKRPVVSAGVTAVVMMIYAILAVPGLLEVRG